MQEDGSTSSRGLGSSAKTEAMGRQEQGEGRETQSRGGECATCDMQAERPRAPPPPHSQEYGQLRGGPDNKMQTDRPEALISGPETPRGLSCVVT